MLKHKFLLIDLLKYLSITIFVIMTLICTSNAFAQEVYVINSLADDEFSSAYDDPNTPADESKDGICGDELGRCTLRAAIEEAYNRNAAAKFIFNVSGTIDLYNFLEIPDNCEIDGANQIEISGFYPISAVDNTKIKGLRISTTFGVEISGTNNIIGDPNHYNEFVNSYTSLIITGDNNKVINNYFGITKDGNLMPNQYGLMVAGSNNEIGEVDPSNGNVFCGNQTSAIEIATGSDNKVKNNLIGTTADGRTDAGNKTGILIGGSDNNIIGGETWEEGNVISGNNTNGIFITASPPDSYSDNNIISHNIIGLKPDKSTWIPNNSGITITNATMGAQIYDNIISGNDGNGIEIFAYDEDSFTLSHVIYRNFIGTDGGENVLGNDGYGIYIGGNVKIVAVGQDESNRYEGNTIVGNRVGGVYISALAGFSPERIVVRDNKINTNGILNLYVDTSANIGIKPPYNLKYNSGLITGKHLLKGAIIDIYSAKRFELAPSAYFRIGTTHTDSLGNFSYYTNQNIESIAVTATEYVWGNTSSFARLDIVTDVADELKTVTEYSLKQNYPNPFNPSTRISFSIPKEEFVSLIVYNSLGEEVAELVKETKSAGNYSVSFNAGELTSGIYFYQIKAGDFLETRKMILMR